MKIVGFVSLAALVAACGRAQETAEPEEPSAEAMARPTLTIGKLLSDAEVKEYLAQQARLVPKNASSAASPLPDNPLLIRADGASERGWVFRMARTEPGQIAEQFAAEYSRIASEQTAQPSSLTIPAALRSPDFLFGLETRSTVLWLHAHTMPRLYTVTSRAGEILAEGIELDDLERRFPEFAGFERLGETDLLDD